MPGSEQTSKMNQSPRPWQKALLLVVALLAAVHTLLVVAWLAPTSPVRNAVGQARLVTYIDPYFQQSWSAISPNAQQIDETLRFRAQVLDVETSKKKITPWFDLTSKEDRFRKYDLEPARVHLINRRLATNLNASMFALNATQRELVNKDYVKVPVVQLAAKLQGAGSVPAAVSNYMTYDQMTVQFLSLYAAAQTGDEVLKIQYKVGRRTVPAFKDRKTVELGDKKFTYFAFGWRHAYASQLDAQSAFDSYLGK